MILLIKCSKIHITTRINTWTTLRIRILFHVISTKILVVMSLACLTLTMTKFKGKLSSILIWNSVKHPLMKQSWPTFIIFRAKVANWKGGSTSQYLWETIHRSGIIFRRNPREKSRKTNDQRRQPAYKRSTMVILMGGKTPQKILVYRCANISWNFRYFHPLQKILQSKNLSTSTAEVSSTTQASNLAALQTIY